MLFPYMYYKCVENESQAKPANNYIIEEIAFWALQIIGLRPLGETRAGCAPPPPRPPPLDALVTSLFFIAAEL